MNQTTATSVKQRYSAANGGLNGLRSNKGVELMSQVAATPEKSGPECHFPQRLKMAKQLRIFDQGDEQGVVYVCKRLLVLSLRFVDRSTRQDPIRIMFAETA
jgi:hypothetical protein